jgi:hypothetical protein
MKSVAEGIDDFERAGLLALDPVRIDGVDEGDGVLLADAAGDLEGIVEVAVDGKNLCAVRDSLGELALSDAAVRHEDVGVEPAVGGVGGGRGAGISRGGANYLVRAGLGRTGDGDDHAPVLEGAGGIAHLQLEVELLAADTLDKAAGLHKRGIALTKGDAWGGFG